MRSYSFVMSLSPGVTPKVLSQEGIGRSERDVVVLQEIEPKVRFLILRGLYTYMGTALKLPLNLVSYIKP